MSLNSFSTLTRALRGASQEEAQLALEAFVPNFEPTSLTDGQCEQLIRAVEAAGIQVPKGKSWKPSTRVRRLLSGFVPRERPRSPVPLTTPQLASSSSHRMGETLFDVVAGGGDTTPPSSPPRARRAAGEQGQDSPVTVLSQATPPRAQHFLENLAPGLLHQGLGLSSQAGSRPLGETSRVGETTRVVETTRASVPMPPAQPVSHGEAHLRGATYPTTQSHLVRDDPPIPQGFWAHPAPAPFQAPVATSSSWPPQPPVPRAPFFQSGNHPQPFLHHYGPPGTNHHLTPQGSNEPTPYPFPGTPQGPPPFPFQGRVLHPMGPNTMGPHSFSSTDGREGVGLMPGQYPFPPNVGFSLPSGFSGPGFGSGYPRAIPESHPFVNLQSIYPRRLQVVVQKGARHAYNNIMHSASSTSAYVAQRTWKSPERGATARVMARAIDLMVDQFGPDSLESVDAMETIVRHLISLVEADRWGNSEAASMMEEQPPITSIAPEEFYKQADSLFRYSQRAKQGSKAEGGAAAQNQPRNKRRRGGRREFSPERRDAARAPHQDRAHQQDREDRR